MSILLVFHRVIGCLIVRDSDSKSDKIMLYSLPVTMLSLSFLMYLSAASISA